ncbi:MAG: glycosyltransferase family 39 protein, partial [Thermomicrobiales bacterium]|nr:glycosyltransferase family 39 protein [Thermomicrobiales bacterium]
MTAVRRSSAPRRWRPTALALAIVWIAALALRLYGLNWDEGQNLHPDELFVAKIVLIDRIHVTWPPDLGELLDPARSGLNPRSVDPATGAFREFAYGALPLFVTDFAAWSASHVGRVNWNDPDHAYLVGRLLSALLDSLTVLLVAVMATRLGGRGAGLLAAFVAATTPMMIQLSHFFTTDSWLTFFVALCLCLSMRAVERGTIRSLAVAGGAAGLAMATKGSVVTLFAVVALAGLIQTLRRTPAGSGGQAIARLLARLAAAGAAGLAAFALFEPYALLRPDVYVQSLRTQAEMVRGAFDVPFSRGFVGLSPLYPLDQLMRWGMGPAATLLALAGVALLVRQALRGGSEALLLLVWLGVYGAIVGVAEVRFLRYLAPLIPVLAVAAGLAGATLWGWARQWRGLRLGPLLAGAALIAVAAWALAFASIYAAENPRLAASRWIYANVPGGSALSAEYWDDALPRDFGFALSSVPFQYETVTMDLYADHPPAETADLLFAALSRIDYLVLSSNRVETSIRAAPWRYPVQNRMYDLLASGQLGFRPVGVWERPPRLGPIVFDDRGADESFINYDHPRVRIYQRERDLSPAVFAQQMAWAVAQPWVPTRHAPPGSLMLGEPVGQRTAVNDARWSAAATGFTPVAVAGWLLLLVVLQATGVPLAALVFGTFGDRGWGFGRLLGFLLGGYVVWIGASLGAFAFRAIWCWVALLLVAGVSWAIAVRRLGVPAARALLHPRGIAAAAELAFWAVFALFLLFRFINPDSWHPIWGGEKPMEFAHLNAMLRTAHFPPYDPWFSDGVLNYYYYGLYLVAFLLKLTGIPSEIGFNLAQPTVIALLASALFSTAAAIAGGGQRPRRGIVAGIAAVLFGVLVGNLTTAAALLSPAREPFASFLAWTWAGSRAIDNAITEFPFFTGLYADLHAHVVALPITVLAIALCFALALGDRSHDPPTSAASLRRDPATLARFGLLALTLGTLSATNAWDVPTYAAVAVAALWMASARVSPFRTRLLIFAGAAPALAALAYGLFVPFHRHFVALFGALAPVRDPTDPRQWLLHLGGLGGVVAIGALAALAPAPTLPGSRWVDPRLAPVGAALVVAATMASDPIGRAVLLVAGLAPILGGAWLIAMNPAAHGRSAAERAIDLAPVAGGVALTALAVLTGREVLAAAVAIFTLAAAGWLFAGDVRLRFASLLAAAAFGVVAGVELVVI